MPTIRGLSSAPAEQVEPRRRRLDQKQFAGIVQ
jgi:hypothetical protein